MKNPDESRFLRAFGIGKGSVVSIVGAGGKTSLMFRLAREARASGLKTMVSTTTKIFTPDKSKYDEISVTEAGNVVPVPSAPGVYVAGSIATPVKIGPLLDDILIRQRERFDLILLEADGAAGKSLKGWKDTEPVIPGFTTHTIGVVDITTVGQVASEDLAHRFPIFTALTGAAEGETLTLLHLQKMICHPRGLFFHAQGERIVYLNKVESDPDIRNAAQLQIDLKGFQVYGGSALSGMLVLQ